MSEKKSLVEEALIQMRNLEEAITENAKGILANTMKQEINELVKESLQEQDMDLDTDDGKDSETTPDITGTATVEPDAEGGSDTDINIDDVDPTDDSDDDDEDEDLDGIDLEPTDSDDDETEIGDDDDDEEPLDLTNVSDKELIKVFKAMGENDGIIVKKDKGKVHLKDANSDVEYMIELGESAKKKKAKSLKEQFDNEDDDDFDDEDDFSDHNDHDDKDSKLDQIMSTILDGAEEEAIYEIEMDETDEEVDESEEMDEYDEMIESEDDEEMDESEEEEMDESEDDEEMDESEEEEMDESEDDEEMDESEEEEMDESYKIRESKKETKESKSPKGKGFGKVKKTIFNKKPTSKREAMEGKIFTSPKVGKGAAKVGGKNKEVYTKAPTKKRETMEASRTLGAGRAFGKKGLPKPKASPRHLHMEAELKSLREKNEEYKKALNIFREKLNEVAVFNSNLAYATNLFTEHTTTKQEKLNILRRFDNAETLKESKAIYKSIKDELSSQAKPIVKESIAAKIEKVQSSGSAINLIESKTYENPQFLRMKDLMSKIK